MPVTPNLHLELFAPLGVGWREDATAGALLDENMMLIDAAVAGGGGSGSGYAGEKEVSVPYNVDLTTDKGKLILVTGGGTGAVNFPLVTDLTFFCYVKNIQSEGNDVTLTTDDDNGFSDSVTLSGGSAHESVTVAAGTESGFAAWFALGTPPEQYQDILGYTLLTDIGGHSYDVRIPGDFLYLLKCDFSAADLIINLPKTSDCPQNFRFRVSNAAGTKNVVLTLLHPESGEIFGDPSSVTTVTIKPGNGGEVFCNSVGGDWFYVGSIGTAAATPVLFQLNGSDLDVQNKINFTDDGIFQITEQADGELHFDSSGVIGSAETYTDDSVAAEASTRAAADVVLANAITSEATTRATADGLRVLKTFTLTTTAPLTGGGDLSANRTLAIDAFTGDSGSGGAKGAVPAPASGDAAANKYLKANGSWVALAAADIASGLLALARGGTGVDLSATGGTTKILAQDASHVISARDLVAGDIPNLAASKITTGALALARGGTGVDLSATGGTTQVLAQDASHVISARALVAADIPSLPASIITSGVLALAQGGNTFAALGDLIYGGVAAAATVLSGQITSTKKYLSQTGTGSASAAPAWAQIAYADISGTPTLPVTKAAVTSNWLRSYDSTTGAFTASQPAASDITGLAAIATSGKWSDLQNASAALTLANGANATTFNQTAEAIWTWANTTVASSGANNQSPILKLLSEIWTNGADTAAGFSLQNKISTTPNSKTITNSVENSGSTVTLTVGSSHLFVANTWVTFTGLTTATWLNGTTALITSVTATTILFQDPTSHGTSATHADTGTATLVPNLELTITTLGTNGDARVIFPIKTQANGNTGAGGFAFAGQSNVCVGYGPISLAAGGFGAYCGQAGSQSSLAAFGIYTQNSPVSAAAPTRQIANWEFGDNSDGNSTTMITAQLAGMSVGLQGNRATAAQTSNPCVILGNSATLTNTSNTMIGLGIGFGKGVTNAFNFAPTSGSGNFIATQINATLNMTGGASGVYTMLKMQAIETALGNSGNNFLDFYSGSAGTTRVFSLGNAGTETTYTPNGAQWTYDSASELLTLSTGSATTDTTGNLLPANSIIEAVLVRVTTAITTAASFTVGDSAGTTSRFATGGVATVNSTLIGLLHWSGVVTTLAAGPSQPSAAKVRITCNTTPGAGVVRVTVFYRTFIAPTS